MKRHISLIALLTALILTGCSDYLDETPKGTLIPKTVNDFGMMLDDATFGSLSYIALGQNETLLMGDEIQITPNKQAEYSAWGIAGYKWDDYLFGSNEDDRDYNGFYHAIYICNYIIANVGDAKEGTQFTRQFVEGSARFTRAYAYLTLVNMYARQYDAATALTDPGVALVLDADPNQSPTRATVQEVYDQIIDDATRAETLLESPEQDYTFRPGKIGACGLLARIYLYMEDYAKCQEYARKARLLSHEPFDYNQLSVTMMNPDLGITGWPGFYIYGYQYPDVVVYKAEGNWPMLYQDFNLSDEMAALYEATDLRLQIFLTTYGRFGFIPGVESLRVAGYYNPSNKGINIGEIYLMNAEAAARTGNIDEALECLNILGRKRHKAGTYEDVTERDTTKLLQLILDERRR